MLVKVYSPTGEAFEVSSLNANDLVQHSGWSRTPPKKAKPAPAPVQEPVVVEDETEFEEETEEETSPPSPPPPPPEAETGLAAKKARVAAAQAKAEAKAKSEEAKKARKSAAERAAPAKRLVGTKEDRKGFVDDPNLSPEENHQRWLNTITGDTKVGGTDAPDED